MCLINLLLFPGEAGVHVVTPTEKKAKQLFDHLSTVDLKDDHDTDARYHCNDFIGGVNFAFHDYFYLTKKRRWCRGELIYGVSLAGANYVFRLCEYNLQLNKLLPNLRVHWFGPLIELVCRSNTTRVIALTILMMIMGDQSRKIIDLLDKNL